MDMPSWLRNLLAVSAAVATVAAVVWAINERQSASVERSFEDSSSVTGMLTGMLEQESALRGYLLNRERSFLEPFGEGRQVFATELARLRRHAGDFDASTRTLIDRTEQLSRAWNEDRKSTRLNSSHANISYA